MRVRFFTGCPMLLAVMVLAGSVPGQEAPAAKDTWRVETFHLAIDEGFRLQAEAGNPSAEVLKAPAQGASEADIVEHIRRTTAALRQNFAQRGLVLPAGTAALCDTEKATLAVRANASTLGALRAWTEEAANRTPVNLVFTLNVVEADGALLRQILREASRQCDQTGSWQRLAKAVESGQARSLETLHADTRSGQRASAERGYSCTQTTGFVIDEKGGIESSEVARSVSTRLEVDPVLGPDRSRIDLNFSLEHHFAPPALRRIVLGQTTALGRLEIPTWDFHDFQTASAVKVLDKSTILLGVWKPQFSEEEAKPDRLQAAFLRSDMVLNLPVENTSLAPLLAKLADKAEPIPKEQLKLPLPPEGMKSLRIKVPLDFLSMGREESAPDPFARPAPDPFAKPVEGAPAPAPATAKPAETVPAAPPLPHAPLTAQQILEQAGITFPQGARAFFDPASCELAVINTPENLDSIQAFTESILDGGRPLGLVHTLQIFEVDAATLRKLSEECAGKADHTEVLHKLEELAANRQAKEISVLRLQTCSGQRCAAQTGIERLEPQDFKLDEKGRLKATTSSTVAGTRLEVDPVLGPDGNTIDLNFSLEYHYAPPTTRPDSPPQKGVLVIGGGGTAYHCAKVTSAITMSSGMVRLLGVWRPEGSPEWDGKEVLQAAFLEARIVPLQP